MTINYFILCFLAQRTTSIKLIFNIHMGNFLDQPSLAMAGQRMEV